jgi:peptide/nickel transport system permease protein
MMARFVVRRLAFMIFLLAIVSIATFLLFSVLPVDPASLSCGQHCTPEKIAANRIRLGYDQPLINQYFTFMKGIFAGRSYGEGAQAFSCPAPSFGYSYYRGQCVTEMITNALPATISLTIGSAIIWLTMGIGLGVISAMNKGKIQDRVSTGLAIFGLSMPTFFIGLLLIYVFIIWLQIFPFPSYTHFLDNPFKWAQALVLPWFTVAIVSAALYTRLTRDGMLETMSEDYVRLAIAKGLPRRKVLVRYVLRGAITPIVTIAGLDIAVLLGGAIITESVFGLPGMGRLALNSVTDSDLPVIVGITLLTAFFVVVANALVDILYASLDPRVRLES